jgi:hypothetical protein
MTAAKKALQQCEETEAHNMEKRRMLFKKLSTATDEYVAAVDAYLVKTKYRRKENSK